MAPVTQAVTVGSVFDKFVDATFLREGNDKFTDDPTDRGGATKWGVTEARARMAGYTGDMRDLSRDTAKSIIQMFFWTQPGFDRIALIHAPLAAFMLDIGVNRGPSVPSKWLQRFLNVNNAGGSLWPDLVVDGQAGYGTLTCLGKYLDARHSQNGDQVVLFAMHALAVADYIEIAEHDKSQERFEFGWLYRVAFA